MPARATYSRSLGKQPVAPSSGGGKPSHVRPSIIPVYADYRVPIGLGEPRRTPISTAGRDYSCPFSIYAAADPSLSRSLIGVLIQKPYELRLGRIYLKAFDRDLNLERSKAFLDFPARRELSNGQFGGSSTAASNPWSTELTQPTTH